MNLSADIGSMLQPPLLTPPECGNVNFRGKPSRVRRRTRRKETREAGNVKYQSEEVLVNNDENEDQKPHNGNTCASDDTNAACEDFIGPITNYDDDDDSSLTFGTATPFISLEKTSSASPETKLDDRTLDSLTKEEFFSIMDNFKSSVLKDLSSITLFDGNT